MVIEGRWVADESELMDPKPGEAESKIEIDAKNIAEMHNYGPSRNNFVGLYFTMTGLHVLHIIGGIAVIIAIWGAFPACGKPIRNATSTGSRSRVCFGHSLTWFGFLFSQLYLSIIIDNESSHSWSTQTNIQWTPYSATCAST